MSGLASIAIDDGGLPPPEEAIAREREVAVRDLIEDAAFALPEGRLGGPYDLRLGLRDGRLAFEIAAAGAPAAEFHLALGPFRQVVKDYAQICAALEEAQRAMPSRAEAIDMARRGIHDEGARVLIERLEGKAELDLPTARRLFTLICVLHPGG